MSVSYVFLGDSNTCADRFFLPDHNGLGNGFVYHLSLACTSSDPIIHMINKGFDGLTAAALLERLHSGQIAFPESDGLFLLIGINDVGISLNTGTTLIRQNFRETIHQLLLHLHSKTRKLICLTPFLFPYPEEYLTWMEELSYASAVLKESCLEQQIPCVDLQEFFQAALSKYTCTELSYDGIHLTLTGHQLLASHILPYILPK